MEDQQNSSSGGSRTSENCRHGHQWSNTLFNNLNKALSRMSKSKLCPGKKLPYHMVFEDWSLDCVRFSLKDRPDLGSHILLVIHCETDTPQLAILVAIHQDDIENKTICKKYRKDEIIVVRGDYIFVPHSVYNSNIYSTNAAIRLSQAANALSKYLRMLSKPDGDPFLSRKDR